MSTEKKDVQMVAAEAKPEAKVEMVKVKVLRPFIMRDKRTSRIGEIVAVTKEEAIRLTKDQPGPFAFQGSREGSDGRARHNLRYAEPVMVQATA